jgi:oligopeptidase B
MSQSASSQAPVARRQPVLTQLHGHTLQDDYAWMRDKSSPELLALLEAENAYTTAAMKPTEEVQARLYAEMLSHIKETDESVPVPDSGWFYTTRTVEGSQYPIHCRRRGILDEQGQPAVDPTAPEEILLDVNQLAIGQAFMAVGGMSVSPDARLLAYSTDNTGFRQYTLHLRDLTNGWDLPDTAERVGSFTWADDSATLFYTTEDEVTKRQDKLFRHTLGSPDDVLVFEEPDERFNVGVGRTRDRKYILLECGSHTTSECRFLPSHTPLAEFTLIAPRIDDQEYYPDHRNGLFYIRTNDITRNFRLVTAPVAQPDREAWTELFLGDPAVPLEDFDLFQSFCILSERKAGLPTLSVYDLDDAGRLGEYREISFPEPTYTAGAHANREFQTKRFRYSYTSLVSPASVYEYDVASGRSHLLKQQEVPGSFDSSRYASERLWVEAEDGVMVPVSVVYRRDTFRPSRGREAGENPLYVYGYGSYGYALPVGFSPTRLALLDRGVVLAYAHIRGGGELGDAWHDAGKMMVKQNTFTDFIAVVELLLREGYGAADRVAIEGGSAGGLLLGAVVNKRPELFRAVLSHVPFVDE